MKKFLFTSALSAALACGHSVAAATEADIYQAIRSGEPARVGHLLQQDVPPDARDANGNTLLMRAAIYGGPDLLRVLLEKGADVNASNTVGATALMRAAGSAEKIKLLIERGADVNARSALGNTPLILAARANPSVEAVKLLLEQGARVDATNNYGACAIQTAAAGGDLDTVRLLLEHGADPNAHSRGSQDTTLWGGGRSPLMWAALRGDLAMMKLLLNAGARVNESEGFGTALTQAAWTDQLEAARLLLDRGAEVNAREFATDYTALHWAASSERDNSELVNLLLKHGADPNSEGGEKIDAFVGIGQTPLMLARKRGDTAIVRSLAALHAKVNQTRPKPLARGHRELPGPVTAGMLREAISQAMKPLAQSAIESKGNFLSHASRQQCVSCHQQYLPLSASAFARNAGARIDRSANEALLEMVRQDNSDREEFTVEATFHPEPAHSHSYALFALGTQKEPADSRIDAIVHHLLVIQDKNGPWHNNLPRPPIQTSDVAPTALAIKALRTYAFPARREEIEQRIDRARAWLGSVQAANTEELTYQILGLAWAGRASERLDELTKNLRRQQREDGGWAQLAALESDAYATGQALFSLRTAGVEASDSAFQKGLEYLLKTQLQDGTWHVARRAFPFQPTMRSGFPHSRDSWISASATSWAVMAMATSIETMERADARR